MTVAEHLLGIPPSRRAWQDEADAGRFSDLREIRWRLPDAVPQPRIALRLKSVASAIRVLCAFDGRVQALVLLPPSLDEMTSARLAERARCDWVISDVDSGPALGGVPVLRCAALSGYSGSAAAPMPTDWIHCTSGTTAEPKLVRHNLASLTRTSRLDPQRSTDVRWGLLYDYTRFAGLQVLLQSLLSGATLLAPEMDWALEARIRFLSTHGCTHLGGTPTLWRTLLMTPEFDQLRLRQLSLGGEIADDRLLALLRSRMPGAGIRHIYASTEAGVGFSVNDGRAGFPAKYLGDFLPDVKLKISDGRLFVGRAGTGAAPYLDAPDDAIDADGFIDTGDLVEVCGDRVMFLGRASGVINVGGNKVHPEAVERVLLEHAGVAMARVYARANPIAGALVMADIVAGAGYEDAAALTQSVLRHCEARLDRHQRPAMLRVVERIGATAAGKMSRG